MEKLLVQTPSMEIHQLSDKLVRVRRIPCESLSDEAYRQDILKMADIVADEQNNFLGVLMDNRQFVFTISPETQRWVNEQIFPVFIRRGARYGAFVVSGDIFTNISVEQTLDEKEAKAFVIRYFEDIEEASQWLQHNVEA